VIELIFNDSTNDVAACDSSSGMKRSKSSVAFAMLISPMPRFDIGLPFDPCFSVARDLDESLTL